MGAREQHSRRSDLLQRFRRSCFGGPTNSDGAEKSGQLECARAKSPCYRQKEAARVTVKLSEGSTTSTALCLIRSVFFKDVPDKVVTRSFCTVNPSRAGSNYRLQ